MNQDPDVGEEIERRRRRRGLFWLSNSSLARKIVFFNLSALAVLAVGLLYINASRSNLDQYFVNSLASEAELVSNLIETQLPVGAPVNLGAGDGVDLDQLMSRLRLDLGAELYVFDTEQTQVIRLVGTKETSLQLQQSPTPVTDIVVGFWSRLNALFRGAKEVAPLDLDAMVLVAVPDALKGETQVIAEHFHMNGYVSAVAPIMQNDRAVGVVGLLKTGDAINQIIAQDRERMLQMFLVATLISIGLSLVLASIIASPIADLAAAAEVGGSQNRKRKTGARIRIPDYSGRPDEIGRLSKALRGMVSALYHRIATNEQFAADVAHEIKNPLASLRSAVGTMRLAKKDEQRLKLLEVIEHDVRRLDRLVSDISNASRLDSELVKEEQESFDLFTMLGNLSEHYREEVRSKQIEFITDLPRDPLIINGLEARLAQVFVNLISNAVSFCEEGDAIRLWARQRQNRVLIVVEDTGPGIPDEALLK